MAKEIERKFLVVADSWRRNVVRSQRFEQGYLAVTDACAVRVRVEGDSANINVKSATLDIERQEYEYPIPLVDAREMLWSLCAGRIVTKVRHWVDEDGETWEVDVFEGDNAGLVLAEIELDDRDRRFDVPDWAGKEVSDDERYLNAYLAVNPYRAWAVG